MRHATGCARSRESVSLVDARLLAPIDEQEVWAAGVTYKRSEEARERESVGAARFYDLVYTAAAARVVLQGPGLSRRRSGRAGPHPPRQPAGACPSRSWRWCSRPSLKLVGFTIGNDMSSRDIEGENPLYLPQAKVYDHSCALGPVITLARRHAAAGRDRRSAW